MGKTCLNGGNILRHAAYGLKELRDILMRKVKW